MSYKSPKLMKPPGKLSVAYQKCLGTLAKRVGDSRPSVPSQSVGEAATDAEAPIDIVCISDTHNTQPTLPDGDLLLHAGDLTDGGTFVELQAQLDWLNSQPHKHKVVIAGNHDILLDRACVSSVNFRIQEKPGEAAADLRFGDVHYLCDEQITLTFNTSSSPEQTRQLTIYGSPTTPQFGTWAFQVPPIRDTWSGRLDGHRQNPSKKFAPWRNPDILLTHGPPKGHLDQEGKGSEFLRREIARARPSLVVFGHIHPGYGRETVVFDRIHNLCAELVAGQAGLFALLTLIWLLLCEKVLAVVSPARLARNRAGEKRTQLVNAAAVGGPRNSQRRSPVVVTL